MKHSHLRTLLACACLMPVLAACEAPDGGYYDKNGNWIATGSPYAVSKQSHAPLPGGPRDGYYDEDNSYYKYDRRGYYDSYGTYVVAVPVMTSVPDSMFPPRGMCRVWFPDRMLTDQPRVESCNGIHSRVPAGAYVIFGG